jgi:hypothetical protein
MTNAHMAQAAHSLSPDLNAVSLGRKITGAQRKEKKKNENTEASVSF